MSYPGGDGGPGYGELFGSIFNPPRSSKPPETRAQQREARRLCASQGHRYAVHGKMSPTRLACKRCEDTWQIGPKTMAKEKEV